MAPRVFYGWWMVAAGVVVGFPASVLFYGFSAFLEPVQASFATTTTLASLAFVFLRAETGFATPVAGFLLDLAGPRLVVLSGGIITGVGAAVAGLAPALPVFLLGFLVLGFGVSFTSSTVSSMAIAPWFRRHRARAFATMQVGSPIWAVIVPVLVIVIDEAGWRPALLGFGGVAVAVTVPLSLVYRRRPEELGLGPDGGPPQSSAGRDGAGGGGGGFALSALLRRREFWLLATVYACFTFVHTGLFSQLIPLLEQSVGVERATAGAITTAITVVSLAGRLGLGSLGDYVHPRHPLVLGYVLMLLGVLGLLLLPSPASWIVLLVCYGPGFGSWIPLRYAIQGRMFGVEGFGRVVGALRLVDTVVTVPAPLVVALVRDTTGTYEPALAGFAGLIAAMTLLATRMGGSG